MNDFHTYLNNFYKIDEFTFNLLRDKFFSLVYEKGEIITSEGQVQKNLLFVEKGVQMSYFNKEGKEHAIAFTYPPNLSGIPESFLFQTPAIYSLKALSDSRFSAITFTDLQNLFDESRQLERLFRKVLEAMLAGLSHRFIELHALTIEERFRAFVKRSPQLFQLVQHKYIASYLNINATNFSKLFNTIKF